MYKYIVMSDGSICKEEVNDVQYLRGYFVTLDHFPTEQEYFEILENLLIDTF